MGVSVFLNVPYDKQFETTYLAYIVGLTMLGLSPRPALALPNDTTRLDKLIRLIDECPYSIHDLSRVQVSKANELPRFNMPLELGLALYRAHKFPRKHRVYIFEQEHYRIQESTSDLNAFDAQIHDGTPKGVMAQLLNLRQGEESTVPAMMAAFRALRKNLPEIKYKTGTQSLFGGAAIVNELIIAASILKNESGAVPEPLG